MLQSTGIIRHHDEPHLVSFPVAALPLIHRVNCDVPPHSHDYFEVVLVCGGRCLHQTDQAETEWTRGSICLIAPGEAHGMRIMEDLRIINLLYLPEWVMAEMPEIWQAPTLLGLFLAEGLFTRPGSVRIREFHVSDPGFAQCEAHVRGIAAHTAFVELAGKDFADSDLFGAGAASPRSFKGLAALDIRASLLKSMVHIAWAYEKAGESGAPILSFRPEVWALLDRIEASVKTESRINIEQSALDIGISHRHLGRLFLAATGKSLVKYVLDRRIAHAKRLLLDATLSITEVALRSGFADAAHFSTQFRAIAGCTPRDYRKRCGFRFPPGVTEAVNVEASTAS